MQQLIDSLDQHGRVQADFADFELFRFQRAGQGWQGLRKVDAAIVLGEQYQGTDVAFVVEQQSVKSEGVRRVYRSHSSQQFFNIGVQYFQTYFFAIAHFLIGRMLVQDPAFMLGCAINDVAHHHALRIPV